MEHHDDGPADCGLWCGDVDVTDLTKPGTKIDLEKMRSVGVISKRTKPRVIEGRSHPESGLPFKATTDENNATVTEHGKAGAGVSERQDVHVRPKVVEWKL